MSRSATSYRPRATSQPYHPDDNPHHNTADTALNGGNGSLRRKGSFSFLHRSKSRDRSSSGSSAPQRKLSKKERVRVREQEMMAEKIPPRPPTIPRVPHPPDLQPFGERFDGGAYPSDGAAIMSDRSAGSFQHRLAQKTSQENIGVDMYRGQRVPPVPPIPPIPGLAGITKGPYVDAIARTESMTHRGRYSYASSAISTINSPRKIRRRKDPTPFNILVIGTRGSGKTSFLNFLAKSLELPAWKQRQHSRDDDFMTTPSASATAFPTFTANFVETEVGTERIGVTLWDSEGLEASVVDIQIQKMASFVESKFEETFDEENQVARAPGFRDTHIHCVFLLLDPSRLEANYTASQKAVQINDAKAKANSFARGRPEPSPGGLDENLDLNVLRGLKGRTTVIPIIAKADTITSAHTAHLKRAVWESLKRNGLDILEALNQEEEEEEWDEESHYEATNRMDSRNGVPPNSDKDADKFSSTSVLDSPSDSDSEFSASDFDLAKPGKPTKSPPTAPAPSTSTTSTTPLPHKTPSETSPQPLPPPPPLPLSILSPDPYSPHILGRQFSWGLADPMNAEHCDFVKLKEAVFTDWRCDLRTASREVWYENWRTSRLNKKARREGGVIGGEIGWGR